MRSSARKIPTVVAAIFRFVIHGCHDGLVSVWWSFALMNVSQSGARRATSCEYRVELWKGTRLGGCRVGGVEVKAKNSLMRVNLRLNARPKPDSIT